MPFISEEDALIFGANGVRVSPFLLVKTSGAAGWLRLWGGVGNYAMAANNIDTLGGVYTGLGEVIGMPTLSQLINGVADRIEFQLSGVDPKTLALVDADAETVRSAAVHVALVAFDDAYQAATQPAWVWEGEADVPTVSRQSTMGQDGTIEIIRAVSLSVGSVFTGRRRPKMSYLTGVEQRRRSPDDAFCDRVSSYAQGTTDQWP